MKTYTYTELNEDAKLKARVDFQENRYYDIENEFVKESFEYELEERGLPTDEVEFSLNYCKGDGVAFYGTVAVSVEVMEAAGVEDEAQNIIIDAQARDWTVDLAITRNSFGYRYAHWNTMDVELTGDWAEDIAEDLFSEALDGIEDDEAYDEALAEFTAKVEEAFEDATESIAQYVKDVSRELEAQGYAEFDYYNSDEYIDSELTELDYEYTEEGERVC